MECGHLERVESEGKPTVFMGEIDLPGVIAGDICLVPVAMKRGDKSPDYDVKVRAGRGWFTAGSAWVKAMNAPRGDEFFSITIDGPTFTRPHYVSAFPDDADQQPKGAKHPVNFTIKWSRPKRSNGPATAAPAPAEALDDAIPY